MSAIECQGSAVERKALERSSYSEIYPPVEKSRVIVAENFPAMGKLTALRFVEWVQQNPGGVISLPTGKTPEHFIYWVKRFINTWDTAETKALLEENGIDPAIKPDMFSLHFVQIDEFYPISSSQKNSFTWYVKKYYIEGFGLDPQKALLIDCEKIGLEPWQTLESAWPDMKVDISLRYRQPLDIYETRQAALISRVDQWCQDFEQKVRKLGGIGFFLGGIGPDGHIGFNVRGSDHLSTTRLTPTNYETQAAAATDLGGMEVSSTRLVITTGLGTYTYNPDCCAIIMAAGEAKSAVVRDAIESEPDVLYPATTLQKLPNACFYITEGASKLLSERSYARIASADKVSDVDVEKAVIDLALSKNKRLIDLGKADFESCRIAKYVLDNTGKTIETLTGNVRDKLIERIEKGANTLVDKSFLHTEPHHDDIMLGYMPALVRTLRPASNQHDFVTMTSGFTSVTSKYLSRLLDELQLYIENSSDYRNCIEEVDYFSPNNRIARNRDVWQYLDGVAAMNEKRCKNGCSRRLLRNIIETYNEPDMTRVKDRIAKLKDYFAEVYPGQKDTPDVQKLKGMCREWEAECLWGYWGWNTERVHHLRLGFYSGDIFTEEPTESRDVPPIVELLKKCNPDVVSVAFDPEGSGPDTHYKVMQAVAQALREYENLSDKEITIWGYRNVWYRFHPAEANRYIPVSLNQLSVLKSSFMNSFISQKEASFPSYEYDGPFCDLAQKIQVEQYQMLKTCLGREWFYEHSSPLIRATRGFVFLNEMSLNEFFTHSRELQKAQESR